MSRNFPWRIALPYMLLFVFTMLLLGVFLSGFVRRVHLQDLETSLTAEARLIADNLAGQWQQALEGDQFEQLAQHWAQLLGARVTIISAEGVVLGESHDDLAQTEGHLAHPEIQQALLGESGSSTRFSRTLGYDMFFVAIKVLVDGQLVGFARLALPLDQIDAPLSQLRNAIFLTTALLAIVILLLATVIAARTTRPLRQLTLAANQIAAGDFNYRDLPSDPHEIGQLAQAFKGLASQLGQQVEALQSERGKLSAILDQMTDGVLIADHEGKLVMINPAAEKLFSTHRSLSIGHSLVQVLRHHQFVELWRLSSHTGEEQVSSVELPPHKHFIQAVVSPLGGIMAGYSLLLFRDFTHVRRLETVRRDFISNLSHELRTPLASLKALAETLQSSALEDPPMARRFLEQIDTEVDALTLMVNELLELSRIESGRVPLQLEPADPCELLARAKERLRLQAERARLVVHLDCPGHSPLVLADPPRLEQVLVNLIHNAIKFTPAEGEIVLTATSEDQSVRFSVIDTGVGIPSTDLPRVFERFYKADRARAGGGTGLGLSIARHLVEAHRGRISVESVEGRGSTFSFTIPLAADERIET